VPAPWASSCSASSPSGPCCWPLFGQLTKRVPNSDGGLYAYSRHEFGDFAGYLVGWCYWIQAWAGNAAIVSSWVFYVDALFGWAHPGMENWRHRHGRPVGAGHHQPGRDPPDGLVPERHRGPQVPAPAVRRRRRLVLRPECHFGPFNASGGSLYSGIGIAAGVALFSFIGVEAAAMTAKRVKNPRINVSRASLLGTALSAILYVLVTAVVMGLVAHHTLVGTGSPFVNAFQSIFPHEAWAGKFIAAIAVISGIGALNGWTLIVTETSRAMAQDDMFPRPFAWTDKKGTAWFGILVGTALPSLLMLWRYNTSSGSPSSPTWSTSPWSPWPSPTSCRPSPSSPTWSPAVAGQRVAAGPGPVVAGASVLFSMWVTFASGYQVVYQALVVILAGLILYAFLNARRQRLGEAPEPVDLPDDLCTGRRRLDGQSRQRQPTGAPPSIRRNNHRGEA
jgi:APA family basic amino acid/polyamine antiporter